MWRLYTKDDAAAVNALHAALVERVGENFELPALDERPVLIGLVREDAGTITHAIFLEAQAELCAIGESAIPQNEWNDAERQLVEVCKLYDLHFVRAFIPAAALDVKEPKRRLIRRLVERLFNYLRLKRRPKRQSPIERLLHHFGFVREDLRRITPFTRRMA